jgi:hypothetical protein
MSPEVAQLGHAAVVAVCPLLDELEIDLRSVADLDIIHISDHTSHSRAKNCHNFGEH